LVYVLVLVNLAACAEGAASPDRHNCSTGGEVCIEVRADEPISFGEPVNVTITVTSQKDISRLGVSLNHDVDIEIQGPQGWEKDLQDAAIYKGGVSWGVAVTASNSANFSWKLFLPPRDGVFRIRAQASTTELFAEDMIRIYMTHEGGKVYLSGTPIPITHGPELVDTMSPSLLATLQARPTETPYPTLTIVPTTEAPSPLDQGTPVYPPPETPYP
jgi:hypothetical protein